MIKKLLPVAIVVVGLGAGLGAGLLMRPSAEAAETPAHAKEAGAGADHGKAGHGGGGEATGTEIVSMENQFVIPVIDAAEVSALVVLSLDLEVDPGGTQTVERLEPKLRDAFLSVLFEHSNAGGFHGAFTSAATMDLLRSALRESANSTLDGVVREVLITNIVRQRV